MKKIIASAALLGLIATPVFADVATEITIAQTHAGLAAKAADIDKVHMHLHHALNCLVGPSGDGFDATNANPCGKAGAGIIPDSTDAAQKTKLATAVSDAKAGIAATDLATAQASAQSTADAIGAAK